MKVGIPKAFIYYDYNIIFEEFFKELGVEVILSKDTNRDILNDGVKSAVDEACFPVKVFHGHVEYLKDKVDYIFIPKIISVCKKEYNCPKILGLPDMVKHSIKNLPTIIDTEVDMSTSNKSIINSFLEAGSYFTDNKFRIIKAYYKAVKEYNFTNKLIQRKKELTENLNIMVVGHSYNLYDEYISMGTIDKLKEQGINVFTPEMIDTKKVTYYAKQIPKRMFWTCGKTIVGSTFSAMYEGKIDGIIYISSFGCGLDSILEDLIRRKAKELSIPHTLLTVDEHSGEAGINTRIEAFIDMINWRDKNEVNISSHG